MLNLKGKSKYPIIIFMCILVQFILYILYINNSSANIIFQDQFDFIPIIEKLSLGTVSFNDLWKGHLEHRVLGYNLIVVINGFLFNTNTIYEMYLGAIILIITSLIMYKAYEETHKKNNGLTLYKTIIFCLIVSLLFSLIQWENIVLSLGMSIIMRMLFFILTIILFDNILKNNNAKVYKFLIALTASILVFGAGYSPAVVLSFIVILGINLFVKSNLNKKRLIKVSSLIVGSSLLLYLIYFQGIYNGNLVPEDKSILEKIFYISNHSIDAIKFVFMTLTSSVIGVDFYQKYLNDTAMIFIGSAIILLFIGAIYIYFKQKIYLTTWIPLVFIIYSFTIIGLITIGRFNYGINYGTSSRYTTDTQYGIIGLLWIISLIDYKGSVIKKSLGIKLISSITVMFILLGYIFSNALEWRIAPYRKAHFENLRNIAVNIDNASQEELSLFQYPTEIVRSGLETLRKSQLNVYSSDIESKKITHIFGKNYLGVISGFYTDENAGYIWTNKEVIFNVNSPDVLLNNSIMVLKGIVPDQLENVFVTIEVDNQKIYHQKLSKGEFKIEFPLKIQNATQHNVNIKLKLDKIFIPKEHGINGDERELGLQIQDIDVVNGNR